MSIELSLAVQYGVPAPDLPRWRLRRWALQALAAARADGIVGAGHVALSIRLVDQDEGQSLNREFRGKDYATNVLTFEYGTDPGGVTHGDVVICLPVLQREAVEQDKPFLHHAAHLTIHGCLHALGYDHLDAEDAERMETLETRILARMSITDPYTLRPGDGGL